MKRVAICLLSMAVVGCLACVATLANPTSGTEDPTAKEIMKALHGKSAKAPIAILKTALKSASPNWDEVQAATKTYAELGAALPRNDAPKGDQAGFDKRAKAFAENAQALNAAASKKDLDAMKAVFGKIVGSCMECHKAHRP